MRFAAKLACNLAEHNAESTTNANPDAVAEFAAAQADLLDALGLVPLAYEATPEALLSAMKHDKKARGGDLRFVLADDIATWRIRPIADDLVLSALTQAR